MAKRIYTLAKKLGVDSKVIVAKCQAEGLGSTIKNHMSTVSAGLEATIQEWFSEAETAHTAVETTEKVDVAAAKRKASKKRKKRKVKVEKAEDDTVQELPEAIAETPTEELTQTPPLEAQAEAEPETEAPKQPEQPAEEKPAAAATLEPEQPQIRGPVEAEPLPEPEIVPSPKHVPAPAKLQGPKVIRVEKADQVRPIRPRPKPARRDKPSESLDPAADISAQPLDTSPRSKRRKGQTVSDEDAKVARRPGRRRGRGFEVGEKLKEWRDRDLLERTERLAQASGRMLRGRQTEIREVPAPGTLPRSGKVVVKEPITVKYLSAAMGVKGSDIITKLMAQGVMASLNATIQTDVAELLSLEYGVELEIQPEENLLDAFIKNYEQTEPINVQPRPPVVTFLGHVDHGKTSLLDRIRSSQVVDGEAGGITQHIGAYRVHVGLGQGRDVAFLDTPGHEAFTAMRARGANMTDIVVLVVAADDGVMPQTEEAIHHAKAAGVPVVVALNKIDLPGVDENRILGQLAEKGLSPHEWGGDTEIVRTSATTGQGVEDLLEHLSYVAELENLKADVEGPASGAVIEAELDPGRGVLARLLVQRGTLKVGDVVAAGASNGRIRALIDETGKQIEKAGPSTPIEVMGLDVVPTAGDKFYVTKDMTEAKTLAEEGVALARQQSLTRRPQITLENFMGQIEAGEIQELCLILRADVQGSVDVLCKSLNDLSVSEIRVKILQAMVGGITEGDVLLAQASGSIVIGFNVVAGERARMLAEKAGVEIRLYRIIYEIMDDIRAALEKRLAPRVEENITGHVQVRQTFKISRLGTIAGCYVTDGSISRSSKARIIRESIVLNNGLSLDSLKRGKDDAREVKSGLECGIKLAGFDDVKEGDIIELYERVEIARTLSSVAAESNKALAENTASQD